MTGAASSLPAMPTMPHIYLPSPSRPLFRARNFSAQPGIPSARARVTASASARHVLGDDAARADDSAVADLHRRDQRGVRADERARADIGVVLVEAVVIAGDGARADIRARADARIADIGEVVGLGALFDRGVLHLDEIADMRTFADLRAGTQPRIGPDDRAAADFGAFQMREGADFRAARPP